MTAAAVWVLIGQMTALAGTFALGQLALGIVRRI